MLSTYYVLDTVLSPFHDKELVAFKAITFLCSPKGGGEPSTDGVVRAVSPRTLDNDVVKCMCLQVSSGHEDELDYKLLLVNGHA